MNDNEQWLGNICVHKQIINKVPINKNELDQNIYLKLDS